jgi:hypothetical protein
VPGEPCSASASEAFFRSQRSRISPDEWSGELSVGLNLQGVPGFEEQNGDISHGRVAGTLELFAVPLPSTAALLLLPLALAYRITRRSPTS